MLKTKVGYSENADAFTSGVETAKMAGVIDNPQVGLFFTSCEQDQKELMKGAKSVLGNVPLIGCTSSAAICTQDGYLNKETGYSGMMLLGGDVKVGCAASSKSDSESAREIGRRLAAEAMKKLGVRKPDYFFMSASPKEEEEYILGIQDVIGQVPIFGGSAADNTVEGKWSIFLDEDIFSDGCAIAIIATESNIANVYNGEYKETDKFGVMTKVVNDRTLVEIDGVPALERYCDWTGKNESEISGANLLTATIFNPIGVKDITGRVTAVRHPMSSNEDKSMNIGARLVEKTTAMLLELTPEEMVEANPKCIREVDKLVDANSYFLVHCGGRRLGLALEGKEEEIYPEVKKQTGDKEFLMVFTFGEYGTNEHSGNTVGGLSLSYTGFGE